MIQMICVSFSALNLPSLESLVFRSSLGGGGGAGGTIGTPPASTETYRNDAAMDVPSMLTVGLTWCRSLLQVLFQQF